MPFTYPLVRDFFLSFVKATYRSHMVTCTRTCTTAITILRSRTIALLPAAATRGCAVTADAAPPAMGMVVGGL